MVDKYPSITELRKLEREGEDFRVVARDIGSKVLVMAIHGGGIDVGTSELARAVAAKDHNLYMFEGIKITGNWDLHVTGHHFDDVQAVQMVRASNLVVSIHACKDMNGLIHAGGLSNVAKPHIIDTLALGGYRPVQAGHYLFRSDLRATEKTNICNLGAGQGVQLEIGKALRRRLFYDLDSRIGRAVTTPEFHKLVAAIRVGSTNYMATIRP